MTALACGSLREITVCVRIDVSRLCRVGRDVPCVICEQCKITAQGWAIGLVGRACMHGSYRMMRPGLAQCDSVLQPRVGPKRRLVFERPRNGERATLWVDKHRVLQAQGGVDPIAKTAITRRCAV